MDDLGSSTPPVAGASASTPRNAVWTVLLALLTAALVGAPAPASAKTTFNVTGVGCVFDVTLSAGGTMTSGCFGKPSDFGYNMTGTVTIDAHGAPDAFSASPFAAFGQNWVTATFDLHWTGPSSGSFSTNLPGVGATVINDVNGSGGYQQSMVAIVGDVATNGPTFTAISADLSRMADAAIGSWLKKGDLSFVEAAGLAPGPAAINQIHFQTLKWTLDPDTGNIVEVFPGSRTGDFDLTSMTIAAVPEPDTSLVMLAGVAALGVVFGARGRGKAPAKGVGGS